MTDYLICVGMFATCFAAGTVLGALLMRNRQPQANHFCVQLPRFEFRFPPAGPVEGDEWKHGIKPGDE